jgi:hypothetical protein
VDEIDEDKPRNRLGRAVAQLAAQPGSVEIVERLLEHLEAQAGHRREEETKREVKRAEWETRREQDRQAAMAEADRARREHTLELQRAQAEDERKLIAAQVDREVRSHQIRLSGLFVAGVCFVAILGIGAYVQVRVGEGLDVAAVICSSLVAVVAAFMRNGTPPKEAG